MHDAIDPSREVPEGASREGTQDREQYLLELENNLKENLPEGTSVSVQETPDHVKVADRLSEKRKEGDDSFSIFVNPPVVADHIIVNFHIL